MTIFLSSEQVTAKSASYDERNAIVLDDADDNDVASSSASSSAIPMIHGAAEVIDCETALAIDLQNELKWQEPDLSFLPQISPNVTPATVTAMSPPIYYRPTQVDRKACLGMRLSRKESFLFILAAAVVFGATMGVTYGITTGVLDEADGDERARPTFPKNNHPAGREVDGRDILMGDIDPPSFRHLDTWKTMIWNRDETMYLHMLKDHDTGKYSLEAAASDNDHLITKPFAWTWDLASRSIFITEVGSGGNLDLCWTGIAMHTINSTNSSLVYNAVELETCDERWNDNHVIQKWSVDTLGRIRNDGVGIEECLTLKDGLVFFDVCREGSNLQEFRFSADDEKTRELDFGLVHADAGLLQHVPHKTKDWILYEFDAQQLCLALKTDVNASISRYYEVTLTSENCYEWATEASLEWDYSIEMDIIRNEASGYCLVANITDMTVGLSPCLEEVHSDSSRQDWSVTSTGQIQIMGSAYCLEAEDTNPVNNEWKSPVHDLAHRYHSQRPPKSSSNVEIKVHLANCSAFSSEQEFLTKTTFWY